MGFGEQGRAGSKRFEGDGVFSGADGVSASRRSVGEMIFFAGKRFYVLSVASRFDAAAQNG
jgi:hypothetical protein